jgi:ATP-dependent helicase YprA (DUF1998 family)
VIGAIFDLLGLWSRLAQGMPWRSGLVALGVAALLIAIAGAATRAWLEVRSDRVAAGPVFAVSGVVVLALSVVWWIVDGIFAALEQPTIVERVLLVLVPGRVEDAAATVRAVLGLPEDRLSVLPPGPVHLPIAVLGAAALYLILVVWIGRTLAELTSLEQKPEDVLARERAEQQRAIAQALKEGRPMPTAEVVSVPLADDLFGRTFKVLGHWTSVELVEERFVRWQRPLVGALFSLLVLALPAALAGHLGPAIWAGAAVALDGLRRNLRTRQAAPKEAPKEQAEEAPAAELLPAVRTLIEAIHRDAGPLLYAPALPAAQPAQISPGTDLKAKRVLDELRKTLPFEEGLLMHQGLACDAFAARKNVLIATPPLSGQEALCDLLVLYTLLVEGESVLYLAPDAARAREAEARLRARAEAARWRWNVHAENIAGRAGSIDLTRSQPGLVFADVEAVHRDLCGRQRSFSIYLGALGLVIMPNIDEHHGAAGAHVAHVLRRLRRAVRKASPVRPEAASAGERLRFLATATPLFRNLGRFAERLIGRPFLVLGPEVDGAPQPERVAYVLAPPALPMGTSGDGAGSVPMAPAQANRDLHPAVQALGEALAQGFTAELFGFEDAISTADVARANEIMLARGVATRGRAFAEGGSGAAQSEALADAQVVVARASAARYAALPLLLSHLGWRAGVVPKTRIAALGAGEHVGRAAAGKIAAAEEKKEGEGAAGEGAEGQLTADAIAAADLDRKVLLLWQPDLDPFAALLATERPPPSHQDLKLGCSLVVDPTAASIQRAHLLAALAEAEVPLEELARDFSREVLAAELGALGVTLDEAGAEGGQGQGATGAIDDEERASLAGAVGELGGEGEEDGSAKGAMAAPLGSAGSEVRLIERARRAVDPKTGAVRVQRTFELSGDVAPHAAVALDASGAAVSVVDRHTGEVLFGVPRERALSAAYPGRIFVLGGRRFSVMPRELQDRIAEGRIACEREERQFTTSKIRKLSLTPLERRSGKDRRHRARVGEGEGAGGGEGAAAERRKGAQRTLGGAPFSLELTPVRVVEEVLGLRRHGPDAIERDTSIYADPIACAYVTRAAVLGFPEDAFGVLPDGALHALAHLFRVTLPAFVHHREEDMEVAWLRNWGPDGVPAIAFIDAHPGGVGFADAISLEVLRHIARWSLAIVRRCPAGCRVASGCPRCLRIARCHAEPDNVGTLDKPTADRTLSLLLGLAGSR